jgi:TonB family protein
MAIPNGLHVAPPVEGERHALADIRTVAKAECQAVEPHVCHERALEVLAGDAGAPEIARAQALMAEACDRGFSTSCVPRFTRPTAIVPARPQYTADARQHGVEGYVLVKCTITVEGLPTNCRILRSLPYLDQVVLEAVAASRYTPVTFLGRPVEIEYVFDFHFKLR